LDNKGLRDPCHRHPPVNSYTISARRTL
jgi:hypothetical protein